MQKTKSIYKKLNNVNKYINSLLEKNLNKLKFDNLKKIVTNNKIVLTFVAVFVLFISYLLLPTFYNQNDISTNLKINLNEKLNLKFNFSEQFNYNFFPRPHFVTKNSIILNNQNEIAKIGNLIVYISLENFFSKKAIKLKDVVIENANFNLNKNNYNFFTKILLNNFRENNLVIKKSNIFFKESNDEVLFIKKILNMEYYYDQKESRNILYAENDIFNILYDIKLSNDITQKKIISKINISPFKLYLENQHNYSENLKTGKINLDFNKFKSIATYKADKNLFTFDFFDKLENPRFQFKGDFNINPFYSNITGKIDKLNLSQLFDSNGILAGLIKTEIFNNKNLEFELNLKSEELSYNQDFKNIDLHFKIQESLIDLNKTKFNWQDFSTFKISDSLFFVKNGELILDGKILIEIKNSNEIYKFLLTPKNYRKELKKVDFNFSYNFDQKLMSLRDIKIDNDYNEKTNVILKNIFFKSNKLQNKIYIKNLLNEVIRSYSG